MKKLTLLRGTMKTDLIEQVSRYVKNGWEEEGPMTEWYGHFYQTLSWSRPLTQKEYYE